MRLHLRDATEDDAELLFRWANDPVVRANALDAAQIEWGQHLDWFARRLADPECAIYVAELDGLPVGQVRLDPAGDAMVVTVSIDEAHRGKGLGAELIEASVARWVGRGGSGRLHAVIRSSNEGSIRSFTRSGFAEVAHDRSKGLLLFERSV